MKFLFKYASRSRPDLFLEILKKYIAMLSGDNDATFVISMDNDDTTMNCDRIRNELSDIQSNLSKTSNIRLFYYYGDNKSKVAAINADVNKHPGWDILFLISDDMVPVVPGFDNVIASDMKTCFPALDGGLHYNDGFTGPKIMTLAILGQNAYQGYIYHPDYQSLCCDNEMMETLQAKNKLAYIDNIIVRHEWAAIKDDLRKSTEKLMAVDKPTYDHRKSLGWPKASIHGTVKKKLICFSLWGDHDFYVDGAIENAILTKRIYGDDWTCRVYIDKTVSQDAIRKLKLCQAEVIEVEHDMPSAGPVFGMFWRFLGASDPDIEVSLSRDTDSRLTSREKYAVKEWMESGKAFHIMRDNKSHGVPVLGGTWGIRGGLIPNIGDLIFKWGKWKTKGDDQFFLQYVLWPTFKTNCIAHDLFPSGIDGYQPKRFAGDHDIRPFPEHPPIEFSTFVGAPIEGHVLTDIDVSKI